MPHTPEPSPLSPDLLLTHLHGNGAGMYLFFFSCVCCQPVTRHPLPLPLPLLIIPSASDDPIKRQLEGVTWSGSVEGAHCGEWCSLWRFAQMGRKAVEKNECQLFGRVLNAVTNYKQAVYKILPHTYFCMYVVYAHFCHSVIWRCLKLSRIRSIYACLCTNLFSIP